MGKGDPRVDDIEKSAPFAQPILKHLPGRSPGLPASAGTWNGTTALSARRWRKSRLATVIDQIAAGKPQNWKVPQIVLSLET